LVDSNTAEDQDLDFKEDWYDLGEKGKFELSKDVAAFANHVGGLVVVGIKESDGVATGTVPGEDRWRAGVAGSATDGVADLPDGSGGTGSRNPERRRGRLRIPLAGHTQEC
jgi:hypothetical protein